MAFLRVVCLFLFAPYSPEPRFGVGVSLPVSHAEIYRNWAITRNSLICESGTFLLHFCSVAMGKGKFFRDETELIISHCE